MASATEQVARLGDFLGQLIEAQRAGELPEGPEDAANWQAAGAALLLAVKREHRRLCESTDALREAAGEAKLRLDQGSLQLQNLLYEKQHYEKEIGSCRSWRSAYTDEQIALIPVDDFMAHPSAVEQQLAAEGLDAHTLMLNRLKHEVAYRQEFVKQLEGVKAQRDALAADVAQKRSTVAGLEAEISKLLAAARAVQQQYSIDAPTAGNAPGNGGNGGAQPEVNSPQQGQPAAQQQQQRQHVEAATPPSAATAGADVAMADMA